MKRAFVAALLAAFAAAARAESPRWGSFELAAGTYHPDIDSEFPGTAGPYQRVFGGHRGWMFRAGLSYSLLKSVGTLDVGLQTGYLRKTGKGLFDDGTTSGDTTRLQIIPTSLVVTYRFDWLADRYRIPLAPYGRLGLERFNWWVTDGSGKSVQTGATNGWSVAGGLALLLDFFDPSLAREMDQDSGVNHTYLFFEARKAFVDDFGSSSSWDLSDKGVAWSGGLLFVF